MADGTLVTDPAILKALGLAPNTGATAQPQPSAPAGTLVEDPEIVEKLMRQPTVGEDIAKTILPSAGRGLTMLATAVPSLVDLASKGVGWGAGKAFSPEIAQKIQNITDKTSYLPTYSNVMNTIEDKTGPWYKPRTTPGKYVGAALEFAPAAISRNPAAVLPNLGRTTAAAMGSEALGQAAEGTWAEAPARIVGALMGHAAPAAVRRTTTPFPMTDSTYKHALDVVEQHNIPLSAARKTNSPVLEHVERSLLGSSGTPEFAKRSGEHANLTAAALRSTGSPARNMHEMVGGQTPVGARASELQNEFANFYRNVQVKLPRNYHKMFNSYVDDYERLAKGNADPAVRNIVQDIITEGGQLFPNARARGMTGERYQFMKEKINDTMKHVDSKGKDALHQVLDDLEKAFTHSLTPGQRAQYNRIAPEYTNLKILEKVKPDPGGLVSPQALVNAAGQSVGGKGYARGQGPELAGLARASYDVLKPRDKSAGLGSTALGTLLGTALSQLAAWASGAGPAGHATAASIGAPLGASLGYLTSNPATARMYFNPATQRYLSNQMWQPTPATSVSKELATRSMLPPILEQTRTYR